MNQKAELALMQFPCRPPRSNIDKWISTLRTAILFIIVSSPFLYKLVNQTLGSLLGFSISSTSGCPTYAGLFLHTIVFALLLRGFMEL
jgi:hypothetical protein